MNESNENFKIDRIGQRIKKSLAIKLAKEFPNECKKKVIRPKSRASAFSKKSGRQTDRQTNNFFLKDI